jgi:phosphinothricin acetyltransferase
MAINCKVVVVCSGATWASRYLRRRFSVCENLGVTVRPANPADAVAIASLLNAFLPTTTIEWTETPQPAESIPKWMDEHESVLVAEERGEVVGVAAFGWFRDAARRPGYRFTVENTIHVREDRWGSGVGRDLMRALVDVARESGKHTMVAAIDGANESSIRFHERLGFVEVARMPEIGAKFGRWLDLVLLQLRLDDRTAPSDD